MGGEFEGNIVGFDVPVDDGLPVFWWWKVWGGAVDTGLEVCEGGGQGDEGVPEESFWYWSLCVCMVFHECDEVAAIAVVHPVFVADTDDIWIPDASPLGRSVEIS